ncbi:MAG: Energy-coupling factor transporter ATP-binding protein EcfA3 [Deltaproteobacteria bacterium ADurb.Bin510]|nr:MAG: Energy-coupling factor transporter ATP-binding protein EcfA3 [Deltaproteobacteria bacterium ADurb.Bin510]
MSHHLVELCDLSYAYPDGTVALEGVSLKIVHGESVGLVGANGAGKSTLLKHLSGCLTPMQGTVRVGDSPLTKKTVKDIRRHVGTIFQDSDDQLFMPTVYDDVAFGPINLGLPAEEVDARVRASLEQVGAWRLAARPPYRLSGGEKKAVAIATVLAMEPDILIMDEPSASLDPKARRQLINLLKTFTHTKLIATHDLDLVLDLCERTIIMHDGRLVADGPTREIFSDDALLEANNLEKPLSMQG